MYADGRILPGCLLGKSIRAPPVELPPVRREAPKTETQLLQLSTKLFKRPVSLVQWSGSFILLQNSSTSASVVPALCLVPKLQFLSWHAIVVSIGLL